MRRGRKLFALTAVVLVPFVLFACQSGPTEEELQAAKTAEDWANLQKAKADLEAKRSELAELQQSMAADPEAEAEGGEGGEGGAEGEEGAETPLSPEELAAQAETVQQDIYKMSDDFGAQLVQFINAQGISVGGELTEMQSKAIRMKSGLDIELAQGYIDGGEYGRAIDIYNQALTLDPDNEDLTAAIAAAEARRFMTEERLAEVKKNMTEDEVRELLGTPKAQNVREFDGGVIGWFYPKEEPNTAAGVFFRDRKGTLKVYKTDFEAVKSQDEES